jgi:hypothetical protein
MSTNKFGGLSFTCPRCDIVWELGSPLTEAMLDEGSCPDCHTCSNKACPVCCLHSERDHGVCTDCGGEQ